MTEIGMFELQLHRDEVTSDGVFGRLAGLGMAPLHTCEDDWRDNAPSVSCIPAGTYRCTRTWSPSFKIETFVIHVPGRSRILFHYGNTEEDTKGCVLVGLRRGYLDVPDDEDTPEKDPKRKRAVTTSRVAFHRFMQRLQDVDEFVLHVTWADDVRPATEGGES